MVAAYERKPGTYSRVVVYNKLTRKYEVGFVTDSKITYYTDNYPYFDGKIAISSGNIEINERLNTYYLPYRIILPPEDAFTRKKGETLQRFIPSKYSNTVRNSLKPPLPPSTGWFGKSKQNKDKENDNRHKITL